MSNPTPFLTIDKNTLINQTDISILYILLEWIKKYQNKVFENKLITLKQIHVKSFKPMVVPHDITTEIHGRFLCGYNHYLLSLVRGIREVMHLTSWMSNVYFFPGNEIMA